MATQFPAPVRPMIPARYHGGAQVPVAVVLHGTVSSDNPGTARNIANWWASPSSPTTSAHYVVDPKEDIQCVGDHTIAYHCGYNTGSIAVEFCDEQQGPASRWTDADSTAILRRGARLTAELCLAYDIEPIRPTVAQLKARGPHGIYGHNDSRLAFGNTTHTDPRDFPWAKFLDMVRAEIRKIKAAAGVTQTFRLHGAHVSLQVQDTPGQIESDIKSVFVRERRRGVGYITGTEAFGPKVVEPLKAAAKANGFRLAHDPGTDSWVAVAEHLITGGWKVTWEKVIEGGDVHRDLGVFAVEFDTAKLGHLTIIAQHLLTARQPNAARKNLRATQAVGDFAQKQAAGSGKVFYGGDQNMRDRTVDTFMGVPFTSLGDELGKHVPTHGDHEIDVMASYDLDRNVKGAYLRSLTDETFPLFGDHNVVEGGWDIKLPAA